MTTLLNCRTFISDVTTVYFLYKKTPQTNNENITKDSPIYVLYLVETLDLVVIGRLTHLNANTHSYTQQLRQKKEKNGRECPGCGQKPVLFNNNKIYDNGFEKIN